MTMIKMIATSTQTHHGAFMARMYPTRPEIENARFGVGSAPFPDDRPGGRTKDSGLTAGFCAGSWSLP